MSVEEEHLAATAIVVGAFPPPRHGQAVSNEAVVQHLRQSGWNVQVIDTSPGLLVRNRRYYWARLKQIPLVLSNAWRAGKRKPAVVYLAASGGRALWLDLAIARAAGRRGTCRTVLHHHSFAYITRRTLAMRAAVLVLRRNLCHVFLCGCMQSEYERLYGHGGETTVLGNLALRAEQLQPAATAGPADASDELVVGFLGSIGRNKGFDVFAELATTEGMTGVRFVCAGPVEDPAFEATLKSDATGYQGVLDATAVTQFLGSLDVLVFPSRYSNEAEPNVIIEAVLSGVPTIATSRGCIREMLSPHLDHLLIDREPSTAVISERIAMYATNRGVLENDRRATDAQRAHLVANASGQLAAWRALLLDSTGTSRV